MVYNKFEVSSIRKNKHLNKSLSLFAHKFELISEFKKIYTSKTLMSGILGIPLKMNLAVDCAAVFDGLLKGNRVPRDQSVVRSLAALRGRMSEGVVSNVAIANGSENPADALARPGINHHTSQVLKRLMSTGSLPRIDTFRWLKG